MLLGGLQKLTLIDYPGKVAATVFTAGCNFFCGFCHNPQLVLVKKTKEFPFLSEEQFFWWLEKQLGFLEGVCITGGEPTIHPDLPNFIKEIKKLGFLVKLDTNGTNPLMLKKLVADNLVDYIAMDIKATKEKYQKFSNMKINIKDIERSVDLIKDLPEHEFRTTVIPIYHDKNDLIKIANWLKGAKKYVLQQFKPETTLDPAYSLLKPYSEENLRKFCEILQFYFDVCELRL